MTIKRRFNSAVNANLHYDGQPCAHCGKDVPEKHISIKNMYGAGESVCDYVCLRERRRTMLEEMR